MRTTKIGFVGLGNMGLPMAENLLNAKFNLTAFDLAEAANNKAAEMGIPLVSSLGQMADRDIAITMLPSGKHSGEVYLGKGGLIETAPAGQIWIDCSTIEPSVAKEIFGAAEERGIDFLDAPVSGGVKGAEAGTLAFIAGGEKEVLEKTRTVFLAMGKKLFHAGEAGAGQTAKLCNNMLLAAQTVAAAEAMQLGIDNGLAPERLAEVISGSTGACWAVGVNNPVPGVFPESPSSNQYRGGFKGNLMLKDLNLAMNMAEKSGSPTAFGEKAREYFLRHEEKGLGDLDFSSVIKSLSI